MEFKEVLKEIGETQKRIIKLQNEDLEIFRKLRRF